MGKGERRKEELGELLFPPVWLDRNLTCVCVKIVFFFLLCRPKMNIFSLSIDHIDFPYVFVFFRRQFSYDEVAVAMAVLVISIM